VGSREFRGLTHSEGWAGHMLDEWTDVIADEIENLARDAMRGRLLCDLGDACVELALAIREILLTASVN